MLDTVSNTYFVKYGAVAASCFRSSLECTDTAEAADNKSCADPA